MGLELLSPSAAASIVKKQSPAVWRASGQTEIIRLTKQNLYRDLWLTLTATPTLTGANNTVANTKKGDEWGVVTNIRVIANGTDVLFQGTGNDLWMLNMVMLGVCPRVNSALGDGATANPVLTSSLCLPFWLYRGRKPMDAAYESFRVNDLTLEITYGTYTDINSAATAWTTAPNIDVTSSEVEPTPNFVPSLIQRIYKQSFDYAAAQTAARINLDTGPYYRGILFNVEANGGGNDLATALTNVQVVAGSTVLRNLTGATLLRMGELGAGISAGVEFATTGIATTTNRRISASNNPAAWYFLNFCYDGYMTEAIRTPTSGDLYVELQTSAACRVNLINLQLFPNPFANVGNG
jgi:hypothetical protein